MDFTEYQAVWNTILTFFMLISSFICFYSLLQAFKAKNRYGGISTLTSSFL
ncbi:MAG: hypothetical protein ACTSRZ_17135 [Promethearchaeota archaeon]